MRYNEKELRQYIKSTTAQLEGLLTYTDPKDGAKERKVRLINSLLLMYKVSPNGVFTDLEPAEVLVLVNCSVREGAARTNTFHLVYPSSSLQSVYTFTCKSEKDYIMWISTLHSSSVSALNTEAVRLRQLIADKKQTLSASRPPPPVRPPPPPPRPAPAKNDALLIDFS